MKRWIIIAILCAVAGSGLAQNVTITGRTNKTETLMRLFVIEDLLNETEKQVAECQSDEKGNFIFEGNVKQILPAKIYVGLESVDLILTPNATYDIEIIVPEQKEDVSYFEKELPTLRVKRASDKGLYRQIIVAEEIINGYMIEHFNQIYRGRQVRYLDSIQNTINRELPDIKSDYVKNHVRYKLASIRLAISNDGGKKVISEFYDGKPVLYTQSAYIDLFKELFDNQFNKTVYDLHALNDAFAEGPSPFKQYIDTDPLMAQNPQLAELVTIYNLQKLCDSNRRTKQFAADHLSYIKEHTKYPEHKGIVSGFFAKFNRLAPGAVATNFTLKDRNGKDVSLSDYKKDVVLLQFVDSQSATLDRQLSRLNELHHQWQDSVQILTTATRDKMTAFGKQFDEKRYDWPLLNLGNNILLLEAYNVRLFPEYILIAPNNKIGQAPAPTPERYLEERVRNMYRK